MKCHICSGALCTGDCISHYNHYCKCGSCCDHHNLAYYINDCECIYCVCCECEQISEDIERETHYANLKIKKDAVLMWISIAKNDLRMCKPLINKVVGYIAT